MSVPAVFRAPLAVHELLTMTEPKGRLLDIGGGSGVHARFFADAGFDVELLDKNPTFDGVCHTTDFFNFNAEDPYDVVWTSHCLEHMRNPGLFLDKLVELTRDTGVIGVIVPPLRTEMRPSHLTLWNAGLLLLNLVKAGLDCSDAHVCTIDYNVCVLVRKSPITSTSPVRPYLPDVRWDGRFFDGDIKFLNWSTRSKEPFTKDIIEEEFESDEISLDRFRTPPDARSAFFWKRAKNNKQRHFYYCSVLDRVLISN